MSSRQLRKLERQKLESQSPIDTPSTEEVEYESVAPSKAKSFNAFSFLEGEEDSQDDNDEEGKSEIVEVAEESKTSSTKSSKKSKKKKKKSKQAKEEVKELDSDEELDRILAQAKARDAANITQKSKVQEEEDSFEGVDDFEEEYNEIVDPMLDYDSNYKNFTTERLKQSLTLLSIDSVKNLDSDEELKNLFGNLSLETVEDANNTTSLATSPDVLKQFKRLARLTKGWGGKDKRNVPGTTRKLLLTRIKDDYLPTSQKPLLMEELSQSEVLNYFDYKEDVADVSELGLKIHKELKLGVKYFVFKKNLTVSERVATTQFYASVVMLPDHDSLMALLRNHPYNAETLLQVSMVILRQGGDKSTSNALIEKCLFVFDRSFHKFFHDLLSEAKNGLIRLPYESFMNRQFYICLFRYITNLGERATYFTSFNYCKFLLSLNPTEDPLGVRYFIDHYAIMSGEYKYLVKLADSPLVSSYSKWFTPGIAFSTVLAYLHLGDHETAATALNKAFIAHPYCAYKMLENIALSSVSFKESDIHTDEEIILSTETYMVRAMALWTNVEHRKFLNEELVKLFNNGKLDKGSSFSGLSSILKFMSSFGRQEVKTKKELPFNLLRFVILSGENSLMGKVPEDIWKRDDVYEFDPLPPQNNTLGYSATTGIEEGPKIVDSAIDYVDQNILSAIIQNRTQNDDFDDIIRQLQQQEEAQQ